MAGWIKIHRTINKHWIFTDSERFRAWMIILLTVNFEHKKQMIEGELITCDRGQSIISLSTWASKFGNKWTVQKVRTFFNLLKKDGMIHTEGLRKTTRLTVCNYDSYQDEQQTDNKQTTQRQHRDNKQITTTKEVKEIKEEYKYTLEREILNSVHSLFDSKYLDSPEKKQKWLDTIRLLIQTDGETKQSIIEVIKFGRTDDFWKSNFLSIPALRKKTDGVSKFDKIKAKINNNTGSNNLFNGQHQENSQQPKLSKTQDAAIGLAKRVAKMHFEETGESIPYQEFINGGN